MSQPAPCPLVPVSWGELLDKITILQIKHRRIRDGLARANVARELRCLVRAAGWTMHSRRVAALLDRLRGVNEELWTIEDAIREHEASADFGLEFVQLARTVYIRNDERAGLKRELNLLLGSELIEEKSYAARGPRIDDPIQG